MYIDSDKLRAFSIECFQKVNVPEKEASIITDVMLEADNREVHSHGLLRLPVYVHRLQEKLMRSEALVTVEKETEAMKLLNGNGSVGQIVAHQAMEDSISKAETTGVGIVSVRNSNHFGIASYYSLMAAKKEMIGMVISNTSPLMPAVGGAEKIIGSNPLSIASPSKEESFPVLDMALSNTAYGKILEAKDKGNQLPIGWGVNSDGVPTTDPNEVIDGGLLLPTGGAKGFGLAFMIEVLTGVLSGGAFSKLIPSMYDLQKEQSISHLMLTIDIKKFIPLDLYYNNLSELTSFIKNTKKSFNTSEVFLPGEIEYVKAKKNREKGIPISSKTYNDLTELAGELGIESSI